MRGRHAITVAIVGAVAILVAAPLTSCGALGSLTRGSAESHSAVSVADSLALPTEVGEVVSEEQAPLLPEGQVAYELDSGPTVLVRTDAALPPAVTADVLAVSATLSKDAGSETAADTAADLAQHASDTTGKNIIIVFQDDDGPAPGVWTHTRAADVPVPRSTDLERVTRHLEDWVAAQAAPASFEIIVTD
ncbi:hypothetical protein [Sanguibacter sp. 25GB23B1]|uniref:hypothetical protein n=1 Tax=unclassified Sanguibacter TaxID=2645534 RepID=UPI0032AF8D25